MLSPSYLLINKPVMKNKPVKSLSKTFVLALVVLLLLFLLTTVVKAQQAFNVTDTQPALVDGLTIGYNIKSAEVKAVGDKGNFSRYSINFYVTNTSSQAKIILYKEGWNILGNVSDQLVQFNCLNATGARMTSKEATLSAVPCNVLALVDDKDCSSNKTTQSKRFVQIGYWIKSGQTISATAIMICPLNERPNVQAVYLANQLQPSASAGVGYPVDSNQPQDQGQYNQPPPPQAAIIPQGFNKVRNTFNNSYINIESGAPKSSVIEAQWLSARWQIMPIPGTHFVNIKNKWKGTYLGVEQGGLAVEVDGKLPQSMWLMESTPNNAFRFKNAQTNGRLCTMGGDQLAVSNDRKTEFSSEWVIEP